MAEGIGAGVQESVFVDFDTDSRTAAIAVGQLIELDSDGYVTLCSAAATTKFIGVAGTAVAATSSASQKEISVQVGGVARVYCLKDTSGYTTSIVPGERLIVGQDNAASYTGQCLVHAPTGASAGTDDFNTNFRQPVAIALEAVGTGATTPVIKKVLLTL